MSKNFKEDFDGAIGIDLGTTYSCVAVQTPSGVEVITNQYGKRTTPSYVGFSKSGETLIGDEAYNQCSMNPTNTIFDAKRLIGRKFNDPLVQADLKLWPFKVVNRNNIPMVEITQNGKTKLYQAEQISSIILGRMKLIAEQYLGKNVKDAVVTVPAYFNDAQRQATRDAGSIAGLNVIRIINEPTSACLSFGVDKLKNKEDCKVLVFDLGGGTFDVSILTVDDGAFYEVMSTAGDTHLGGEDFDHRMVQHLCSEIKRKYKHDITSSKRAIRRLRTACERAKRTLSTAVRANINIDALFDGVDYNTTITRAKFEKINSDLFRGCLKPVKQALSDAKIDKSEIDHIVLVGGSTRIPKVQSLLREYFNGKELCKSINPDEAVAMGAAIQAAVLRGNSKQKVCVVDVCPLSLGIETRGQVMTKLINRNTNVPCTKKNVFTTAVDNQPAVSIRVFEGERSFTKDNNLLGQFDLSDIPPARRGVPKIEVSFSLDANGILSVSAMDMGTGRKKEIKIQKGRLSKSEIDDMMDTYEEMKKKDEEKLATVNAKNDLENYTYQLKATLDEEKVKSKISEEDRKEINEKCDELSNWIMDHEDETKEVYEKKKKEIEAVGQRVFSKLYANNNGGQKQNGFGSQPQQQQQQYQSDNKNNEEPTFEDLGVD